MKNEILSLVNKYAKSQLEHKKFIPGKTKIPASSPSLSPEDVEMVTEAVLQLWYTDHKFCAKFRRELSKQFYNAPYVTLCNSGSSANLLAIRTALELYPYREYIITCATNFPTTVAPIYQCGQIPIYIDIDPITLSPNVHQFQEAIETYKGKISGHIFAHTLGFPFLEDEFDMLGAGFSIVDCCDAMGAEIYYDGDHYAPVGTFADFVTLSFFPAHHITTGEGGAVLCRNEPSAKMLDSFANWGRDCYCAPGQSNTCGMRFDHEWETLPHGYDHKYTFTQLGYNLKMTEWQAALGYSQIQRLPEFVAKRKDNYLYLLNNLWIYRPYLLLGVANTGSHSPFGFPIAVETDEFTAEELIAYLEEHKISTRRVFAGNITRQPGYAKLPSIRYDLSGSDWVMERMFWIGCHPEITKEMLDYILEVFDNFFKEKGL